MPHARCIRARRECSACAIMVAKLIVKVCARGLFVYRAARMPIAARFVLLQSNEHGD